MANARRAGILVLCVLVAAATGAAGDKQEKKEAAADKKQTRSESSRHKKDEAADAKKAKAAESRSDKEYRSNSARHKKDEAADAKKAKAAGHAWQKAFSRDHHRAYRSYYAKAYGRKCPPGLVKKYGGCYWPGHSRRRYVVGELLPDDVVFVRPPLELAELIGPPPQGHAFVLVDGDLVQLLVGSRLVVDAIEGLVED